MNLLSNLSKEFQSYVKLLTSNRELLPFERIYIWNSNRRFSQAGEPVDMELIYQIVGHVDEAYLNENPGNIENHPEIQEEFWSDINGIPTPDNDAYVRCIEAKIQEYGMGNHITIERNTKMVFIAETRSYHRTGHKITIKNLVINAHDSQREMYFYPLPESDSETKKIGVYLVFENNYFMRMPTKGFEGFVHFCSKSQAYLVFKNNNFRFVDIILDAENSSKIELTGNVLEEGNVQITSHSDKPHSRYSNILCLENNIIYSNFRSAGLSFDGTKIYFRGKNTIDFLSILPKKYLHWGRYQNIDPRGVHAYEHKKMFIDLKTKAVQNNDKMQEAILHRELLKCERVLIQEEKTVRSLQDGFILWWSSWISDYGVSWFRPVRLLIYINALLAFIVFHFFDTSYSWWFLFAEFFNPLSSLADMTKIKDSGLISSINILQKAVLAIFVYEIIKIFRRFSK